MIVEVVHCRYAADRGRDFLGSVRIFRQQTERTDVIIELRNISQAPPSREWSYRLGAIGKEYRLPARALERGQQRALILVASGCSNAKPETFQRRDPGGRERSGEDTSHHILTIMIGAVDVPAVGCAVDDGCLIAEAMDDIAIKLEPFIAVRHQICLLYTSD